MHPEPQTPSDDVLLTHRCLQSPRSTDCWAPCWPARAGRPGVGRGGLGGNSIAGGQEDKQQEAALPLEPAASSQGRCCLCADRPGLPRTGSPISSTGICGGGAVAGVRGAPPAPSLRHPQLKEQSLPLAGLCSSCPASVLPEGQPSLTTTPPPPPPPPRFLSGLSPHPFRPSASTPPPPRSAGVPLAPPPPPRGHVASPLPHQDLAGPVVDDPVAPVSPLG